MQHKKDSRPTFFLQEDLDPDSLSDSSKSDDGFKTEEVCEISEQQMQIRNYFKSDRRAQAVHRLSKTGSQLKATTFYIEAENNDDGSINSPFTASCIQEDKQPKDPQYSVKTVSGKQNLLQYNGNMVGASDNLAVSLHQSLLHERENIAAKDTSSFVRQESFTKDKSSSNVSYNKLPHVSTHPLLKDLEATKSSYLDYNQETQQILKETETALAALEAKILSQSHRLDSSESIALQQEDSLSEDSDVDTASTVSLVSSKNAPSHSQTRRVVSSLQKEKSSSTPSIKDQCSQPSARTRLTEKRRNTPELNSRGEGTKRFQIKHRTGTRGSLDFSDEDRNSSLPCLITNDAASSDYEHPVSRSGSRRKPFSQSTREESVRNSSSAQKVQQVLTRSNSLSTPRPTRASKLRRARLGETSDNECADTERRLLSNEVSVMISASSRQTADAKKLSRLDILAMPRKRTGSFTMPSDSETATPRSGFSGRNIEPSVSNRKLIMAEVKPTTRKGVPPSIKQPLSKAYTGSVCYSSSSTSRRRQQGSDYTSTSDEEYGSKHSAPKHKRSHTSTATQTPRQHSSGSHRYKRSGEEDCEDYEDEPDAYQNLMAQTAEIAEIARYICVIAYMDPEN